MGKDSNQNLFIRMIISSLKMAIATFSSRVLGLVRELSMAAVFGASSITDAFLVAYRIPNILRDLFAEGAFSSAFVPIFTGVLQKDEKKAKALLWSLFILLGVITLIIAVLIIVFSNELVLLFAPKFQENPQQFLITSNLIKMMAPFLTLVSIAALFMGALNSLKVFFIPSFAPVFFNVIMIFSIIVMPEFMEKWGTERIYALGIGVVVGGLMQILFQVPMIVKKGFTPQGPIQLISDETKQITHRLGIGTIGIAANQINVLVNTILASGTVAGAVSWLVYAFRFFQFPIGILGVSIASSNLVHFSDEWKSGNIKSAKKHLQNSYILSFFLIMPAFALLYALSKESVHLVFERGAFTREDTLMTGKALKFYAIGLPFYGFYKIFGPIFYTLDRPLIPVMITVGTLTVNIIFCILAVPYYGFAILALGTTFSMGLNSLIQMGILKRLLSLPWSFFLNLKILKVFFAGMICLFVTLWSSSNYIYLDDSFMRKVTFYLLSVLAGIAAFAINLAIMGEYRELKNFLISLKEKK